MKWIKISGRLPTKENGSVLTIDVEDDNRMSFGFIHNGKWVNDELLCIGEPTHWIDRYDIPKPGEVLEDVLCLGFKNMKKTLEISFTLKDKE